MNWNQIEGRWTTLKGKAKERWGELSDDELDKIAGQRDQLVGEVQRRYGVTVEEAERQVEAWSRSQ